MRSGQLNKKQIHRLRRIWDDLQALHAETVNDTTKAADCVRDDLRDASTRLATILRWQDDTFPAHERAHRASPAAH